MSEHRNDPLADEEAAAAAAEAARIGGEPSEDDLDPALRPVIEAGGGYAEGFDLAEADLVRNAEHGEAGIDIEGFMPELESDLTTAEYGDADEVEPAELVADPSDSPADPDAGPDPTTDR